VRAVAFGGEKRINNLSRCKERQELIRSESVILESVVAMTKRLFAALGYRKMDEQLQLEKCLEKGECSREAQIVVAPFLNFSAPSETESADSSIPE
jgi:hypothetical protein